MNEEYYDDEPYEMDRLYEGEADAWEEAWDDIRRETMASLR